MFDVVYRTALHYCVEHMSPHCIRMLISFGGANPNVTDMSGLTPLHYCALYNGEECLQELLDVKNIDIQVFDDNRRLPLHYAAASGNVTILSVLVGVCAKDKYENILS
jgi:ankyrin repeat protein